MIFKMMMLLQSTVRILFKRELVWPLNSRNNGKDKEKCTSTNRNNEDEVAVPCSRAETINENEEPSIALEIDDPLSFVSSWCVDIISIGD